MLATQRHTAILDVLQKQQSVKVTQLSRQLSVTEETIRRDLERLEADGKLIREHGGATMASREQLEIPFLQRKVSQVKEKNLIAVEAVVRIAPGDTIFLDASTSCYQLAKHLPDIDIIVITNSLPILSLLAEMNNIKVICTGGILDTASKCMTGPIASKVTDHYHINKLFISSKGIDIKRGLSEANEGEAILKQDLMALVDAVFLLVDHSKYNRKSKIFFSKLSLVTEVITTGKQEDEFVMALMEQGIAVRSAN